MERLSAYILLSLFLVCLGVAGVEVLLNLREQQLSQATDLLWGFTFVVLVGVWVQKDALRHDFDKPFDFGFFLYLFLPVLLPYYLVRTRGVEGAVLFCGFAFIYWLPWVSGWVAYAYFSAAYS